MKVLVHYDASGSEAYGLWWADETTKEAESLYVDPNGPQAARGRVIVFSKSNPKMKWDDWFDLLTTRAPYSEDWIVYDSMGLTPDQMLSALKPPEPVAS